MKYRRAAVIPAALLFIFILFRPERCLTASSGDRLLFAWPIRAGDVFSVTFLHSLNNSHVTDYIEYTGYELVVRKSAFSTFGGGIPVLSDGIGTELIRVDGGYELIGIDKPMTGFSIMTQTKPDHKIILGGYYVELVPLAGSGVSVAIKVNRVPYIVRKMNERRHGA